MHVMAYMGLFTFSADVVPKNQAYEVNAVLQHTFCRKPFSNTLWRICKGKNMRITKGEYYAKYY